VLSQFGLTLSRVDIKGLTYSGEIARYWGYMTILTNTLVTLIFASSLFFSKYAFGKFFQSHSVKTATTLYIALVGIIYHLLLKGFPFATVLDWFNDLILHTIIPIIYVVYWMFTVPKNALPITHAAIWMIYPTIYSLYTLLKGQIVGAYPYPFLT